MLNQIWVKNIQILEYFEIKVKYGKKICKNQRKGPAFRIFKTLVDEIIESNCKLQVYYMSTKTKFNLI